MQFLLGLIAGLIIGWIIEWIIDWQYWRADESDVDVRDTVESGAHLRHELDEARLQIAALQSELARSSPAPVPVAPDRLERIKGIGPVFARRLNDAGIYTFVDLAQTTPDALRAAVQAEEWQAIDPAAWIAAAAQLATSSTPSQSKGG